MFGKPNAALVLNKNNTVAELQQVVRPSSRLVDRFKRQKLPQKLYNSGF
jgi:hypothetical protein